MKTVNDVLSFEDIQIYDNYLVDSVGETDSGISLNGHQIAKFITKQRPQLIERFIHTFLDWEVGDRYFCCSCWMLTYTSASQGYRDPIIMHVEVDTLREAEIIATGKISRLLKNQIRLERDNITKGNFYKVIDWSGAYRGMVKIEATK